MLAKSELGKISKVMLDKIKNIFEKIDNLLLSG